MSNIDDYTSKLEPNQAEIVGILHNLITTNFSQLKANLKWNMPVYTLEGKDVVYLQSSKPGMNLGFNNGARLNDPKELLQGAGKDMRHIKISSVDEIDEDYLINLLKQAVQIK